MVGEMTMIEVVEGKMATTGSRRIGSAEVGVGSPAPLPGTGKIRWGPGERGTSSLWGGEPQYFIGRRTASG